MGLRLAIQSWIDRFQFWFDLFPTSPYQPLPSLGIEAAERATGSIERWAAIRKCIADLPISTAMDIGSNAGYFSFALADEGVLTLGIEMDRRLLRIALHAAKKINSNRVGFCHLKIDHRTVELLPTVDLTLLLSVWHHWVRYYGVEQATEILAKVWQRCSRMLVFETGEEEMPPEYGLPEMKPSAKEWIENYLSEFCPSAEIHHLGLFKAFAPGGGEKRSVVYRNLFGLYRQ